MSYVTRNLKQNITYWSPGVPDGYGGKTWGTPTTIKGRWEDRTEFIIDSQGRQIASLAVVFLVSDVELEGYLYNGTSTESDPTTVSGAREIRSFSKIPTLRFNAYERRAYL